MTVFDFFVGQDLVRPHVTEADAEDIARRLFGLSGKAHELGSQQDRNFRIDVTQPGNTSYLLKVDNSAFSDAELGAQEAAMRHLGARGVRVPKPVAGLDGEVTQRWTSNGTVFRARMLTYLEGAPLASEDYLSPHVTEAMGRLAAEVARGLESFTSDGLERILQWDMRNAAKVVDHLVDYVPDRKRRDLLLNQTASALERLEPVFGGLREQPIHGDITDDNIVCSPASKALCLPDGVIDFGDLGMGWLVAELAVTVASILHHMPEQPLAVLDAVCAFDAIIPLTDEEISALWPLIVLRGAVLAVSGEHQLKLEADNSYAAARSEAEWKVFEVAGKVGWSEAEAAIRAALGREPLRGDARINAVPAGLFPDCLPPEYVPIDLTPTSVELHDGRWADGGVEAEVAHVALESAPVVVAPYGQYRLTRTQVNLHCEPETFPLFTELFLSPGMAVVSPVSGSIVDTVDGSLRLSTPSYDLRISGLETDLEFGQTVVAGDQLGTTASTGSSLHGGAELSRLRIQCIVEPGLEAPWFTTPSRAAAWASLTLDPAPLLGMEASRPLETPAAEVRRRERNFAAAQERYYRRPPQFERGWREHLFDITGRGYLDMVNNVTAIGHSHPRLASAVHRQMQLLNTNSRFLYRALADLSERIVELAPHPSLDTVLLVNSGTEAVDLALRMAQIHTGRRTVVALREAYHGWSMAADAVSTSAFDNPSAEASRPDWVSIAEAPNPYRGKHRGPGSATKYADELAVHLEQLELQGKPPAAFICEPVLGNAGGVLIPDGYLSAVYKKVRDRGGLAIADEVQVGYGRLGEYFWGVQQQDVAPDIITVAKAMGNAYPLGAVITRKEIAESLSREGQFFSSAGGSPVSSVAGLEILNVLRDEKLQENAQTVGAHLTARLQELSDKHQIIGAVHGVGLYLGVELVRDRSSLEPAREETAAICERLLQLGVIMQATSERQNVLKIKPPLCISRKSADFFVDTLDEVLTHGW